MSQSAPRWRSILFCVVGIVIFALGAYRLAEGLVFQMHAVPTEGLIVGQRTVSGPKGKSAYPIVRYQDETGVSHDIEGQVAGPFMIWKVGDRVEVIYQANSPAEARISGFGNLCAVGLLLLVFGAVFFAKAWFTLRSTPQSP